MTTGSFNDVFGAAARGQAHAPPDQIGDIGIGKGGAAAARPLRPPVNERMNAAIREAGWRAAGRVGSGGVSLDELWNA